MLALLATTGIGSAQGNDGPLFTPLTQKSLQAWVTRVCAGRCVRVAPSALHAGHAQTLLKGATVLRVTRGAESFLLSYDLGVFNGQLHLGQVSFVPVRVQDRWTPTRLNLVAGWMQDLARGRATSAKLWACVDSLKRNQYTRDFIDDGYGPDALGVLRLDPVTTVQGECFWLPDNRNVGFAFAGREFN
ncbi:hypothetical protein [Deinococcus aquaticus]|uniref:hypothetical protein n=1 Tax=Deinococcus aquaticus TaxID=328692 RepID=UPI0031EE5059